jgi:DNA-binding transcriptional MerR regulator
MTSFMPRTPPLDIHALVKRTGIDARTIRRYIERDLLPRPDYAGRNTRYTHEHLVRLLAIKKLYETHARLSVIKAELTKRTFPELEAMVGLASPPPPAPPKPTKPVEVVAAPAAREPPVSGERWVKVAILPGLELMMREDATELVRRIAREIEKKYFVPSN